MSRVMEHIGVDPTVRIDSSERHNVSGEPKNVRLQALVESPSALKTLVKPLVPDRLRTRMRGVIQRHNLTKPEMPIEARQQLQMLYRDDIHRLAELTQLDLSGWMPSEPETA